MTWPAADEWLAVSQRSEATTRAEPKIVVVMVTNEIMKK